MKDKLHLLFIPIPFIFYYLTACPVIGLGDTALLIDQMVRCTINPHVNNHNLAILFGHIFMILPFDEIAFKANLVSVVFGSLTVISFYMMAHRILKDIILSVSFTLIIMVSYSMWWHATIVENYAISAAFTIWITMSYLMFMRDKNPRWIYLASFFAGLSLYNHVQMGIWIPATGIFILLNHKNLKKKLIGTMIFSTLFFTLGFLPYIITFFAEVAKSGNFDKTLYWALGGDFQKRMFDFHFFRDMRSFFFLIFLQYPSIMLFYIILGVYSLIESKKFRNVGIAIFVAFFINTYFFIQFQTWDKFAFMLPSFLVLGTIALFGFEEAYEKYLKSKKWLYWTVIGVNVIAVIVPIYLYTNIATWAQNPKSSWHSKYNNTYTENTHNCSEYIINPEKSNWRDVDKFAELVFEKLPQNSILIDDDSRTYYPLKLYFQDLYDRRKDINVILINSWGFENWGQTEGGLVGLVKKEIDLRPVFFISDKHPHQKVISQLAKSGIFPKKYNLDEHHWIYKVEKREPRKEGDLPSLIIKDMFVGQNLHLEGREIIRTTFKPDEHVMVKIKFEKNYEEVPIYFKWYNPDGKIVHTATTFVIPPGNTGVHSNLDYKKTMKTGKWKVELIVSGKVAQTVFFTVAE